MIRMISAALAIAASLAATGAQAASRGFPVGGFDRVRSNVPFDVRVHMGGTPSVRAQGPQEALDRLIVEVIGGELVIRSQSGRWFNWNWRHERAVIDISAPALAGATLSGPGDLTIDRVGGRRFDGTLRGPGNFTIGTIDTGDLSLLLEGPGDLTVSGRAGHAQLTLRGPGDIRARGLTVRDAVVSVSGPGDLALTATGTVDGSLSGPGDVTISGGARCQISKHGPGDVTCR